MKCKSIPIGMKSAVERGLSAVFHTLSHKSSNLTINVADEASYTIFHHATLHNRVSIICQLCNAYFTVNQRRLVTFSQESSKVEVKNERDEVTETFKEQLKHWTSAALGANHRMDIVVAEVLIHASHFVTHNVKITCS
ncbi:ankyrin and armadillo repeat-containing protein-like [Callithrix jacchus]